MILRPSRGDWRRMSATAVSMPTANGNIGAMLSSITAGLLMGRQRHPVASLACGELGPAAPDDVAIERIDLEYECAPAGHLGPDEGRSGSAQGETVPTPQPTSRVQPSWGEETADNRRFWRLSGGAWVKDLGLVSCACAYAPVDGESSENRNRALWHLGPTISGRVISGLGPGCDRRSCAILDAMASILAAPRMSACGDARRCPELGERAPYAVSPRSYWSRTSAGICSYAAWASAASSDAMYAMIIRA